MLNLFKTLFVKRILLNECSFLYNTSKTLSTVTDNKTNDNDTTSTPSAIVDVSQSLITQKPGWATSDTNPLIRQLAARIKAGGPITVADFMKESLLNPVHGYYTTQEVFGKQGDFTTAPEISQIFGELIGAWIVNEAEQFSQKFFHIVELGPGRGTLMKDILRVVRKNMFSGLHFTVFFLEASPLMKRKQAQNLLGIDIEPALNNEYKTKDGVRIHWIDDLIKSTYNDLPVIIIANEFLDAFPVYKFQRTPKGWKEILVDYNEKTKQLQYVMSMRPTIMSRLHEGYLNKITNRNHVEISPQRQIMMEQITKKVLLQGGLALIGDYGHWGEKEDTFRGFRRHEVVEPLSDPGNIDVTADVDFEELVSRVLGKHNIEFFGPLCQRDFLYNLGIDVRATALAKNKTPEEQDDILGAVEKLVSPEYMGERFKYLCAKAMRSQRPPAGFSYSK